MGSKDKSKDFISTLEIPRRIWHSCIGFVIISLYYYGVDHRSVFWFLLLPLVAYGSWDWYRLQDPDRNKQFCATFPHPLILRKGERTHRLTSSTFYLMGVEVVLLLFSRPVMALSLLYLAWADPVAAIVGKIWQAQKRRNRLGWLNFAFGNGKTLMGSIGAAMTGFLITIIFLILTVYPSSLPNTLNLWFWARLTLTSVAGGIIAAVAEAITIRNWDDNLTMPIASALMLTLLTPIHSFYSDSVSI